MLRFGKQDLWRRAQIPAPLIPETPIVPLEPVMPVIQEPVLVPEPIGPVQERWVRRVLREGFNHCNDCLGEENHEYKEDDPMKPPVGNDMHFKCGCTYVVFIKEI